MPDAPSSPRRALGVRIKILRGRVGLSQEGLADAAELDRSHLARIEAGGANPALDTLARIANGLDVPLSELFTES